MEEWNAAVELLASQPFLTNRDAAEAALAQATNWKNYAMATSSIVRKYVNPIPPNVEQLRSSLNWLLDDNNNVMPNDDRIDFLREAVPQYPKAYLMDPQTTYQMALKASPPHIDAAKFAELWKDDPSLLQYTFNCADDGCVGECGQCWVTTRY